MTFGMLRVKGLSLFFQTFCRAGGPAAPGMQGFLGRGRLHIRRRRLGVRLLVEAVL